MRGIGGATGVMLPYHPLERLRPVQGAGLMFAPAVLVLIEL